jgi:tRNA (guanine37-N1)-methyltransferase
VDGRVFIKQAVKEAVFDHFVMNLPATAIEFLDAFVGLYSEPTRLPMIHCHCFTRDDTADILKVNKPS